MNRTLTSSLLASTLQQLEAVRGHEAGVVSDAECNNRAEEIAEAALQAIAVCLKFLIAKNAEARIDGFGHFYVSASEILFAPDDDVLQYVLLKQQDPGSEEQALRNAFVKNLWQARQLLPLLDFTYPDSEISVSTDNMEVTADEKLLRAIFGEVQSSRFAPTVARLLADIGTGLARSNSEFGSFDLEAVQGEQPPAEGRWKSESTEGTKIRPVVDLMAELKKSLEIMEGKHSRVGKRMFRARRAVEVAKRRLEAAEKDANAAAEPGQAEAGE